MLNLRSQLRRDVLRYFFTNPSRSLYVRELARTLDVDATNLSKELRRLAAEGLFVSERRGNQVYFRLNREYPLFREIERLVMHTLTLPDVIGKSLRSVPGVEKSFLFGSFAGGKQDAGSDIDVLVLGRPRAKTLADVVQRLEKRIGRDVNYVVMTEEEFERRNKSGDAFVADVMRHPIIPLALQ